ncbi:hypothetical protein GDO81_007560 [Engystomops pustulosus]|uniref:Uncharacterized protein n=1 Tax=Engystomops pustulosus TaxID=76066 RepID=A0AAV7C9T1_ENGPU|nr:hypothetical protein GDO81_007560 [Engystomops pustulosus]
MCNSTKERVASEGQTFFHHTGMQLFAAIQVLLWASPTFAILSLTSNPVFTMESLNGTDAEEPKQAFTVPLDVDLENTETDLVTDDGTQVNSQRAVTSTMTPVLSNVTDGGENNIKLSTINIDPKQPITLDVFNMTSTEGPSPTVGSASIDVGDNGTFIPLPETDKGYPFDEQLESFLEIPMENSTEGKQCVCNIPGPSGQKGDKGDRGDPGNITC